MAWPYPFGRRQSRTENTRTCWGHTFELGPDHLTASEAEPLKHSYDVLGARCYRRLNELVPPTTTELPRKNPTFPNTTGSRARETDGPQTQVPAAEKAGDSGGREPSSQQGAPPPPPPPPPPRRDLYALLKQHHATDPDLTALWTALHTVPSWVDWAQIGRGQEVFYRYGGASITGLAYQALLGGMGAARVVETLARTGGFAVAAARRRLFETTQHVLQCTASLASIQPGGAGFEATARVRLLHAAVRDRILMLEAHRPGYFPVQRHGVPISDLDGVATIASFSSALIWLGYPRQGIYLRAREIEDYLALWRYVAYLIGCPDHFFATPAKAKATIESLYLTEIRPSPTSRRLVANVIAALADQPPAYASAGMLVAAARWLNGDELGDALGLPPATRYHRALMAGQCAFYCFWCYLYRAVPALDRRKVGGLRALLWRFIVDSDWGLQSRESLFEFKYVPMLEGVAGMSEGRKDAAAGTEEQGLKKKERAAEHVALRALAMAVLVGILACWMLWRLGVAMFGVLIR